MGDDFQPADFLPYLLAQAAEAVGLGFQKVYKAEYGLLRTEWRVLFHLGSAGAMNATDLGSRAGLHKTKVSRAVAALHQKRLLKREDVESDRRQQTLSLTPRGSVVFGELQAHAVRFEAEIEARLTRDEARVLRHALRKLAATR